MKGHAIITDSKLVKARDNQCFIHNNLMWQMEYKLKWVFGSKGKPVQQVCMGDEVPEAETCFYLCKLYTL